jgi:hypothetical protein
VCLKTITPAGKLPHKKISAKMCRHIIAIWPFYALKEAILTIFVKNLKGNFDSIVRGLYLHQMISKNKKYQSNTAGRSLLAVVMMVLLTFLTSANYFVYPSGDSQVSSAFALNAEEEAEAFPGSPSGPDEKPPGSPVSISEEYIHGHTEHSEFLLMNRLFRHLITVSEKIELVHFELLSPPPEC